MSDLTFSGMKADPMLVKSFYNHLVKAYKRLDERRHAKKELDEHLDVIKKNKGKLDKRLIEELKKRVDNIIEKERRILHQKNRYIPVHETDGKRAKEIERLQSILANLEKRYEKFKKLGMSNLKLKKIEARIEFLKTKIEFLRY